MKIVTAQSLRCPVPMQISYARFLTPVVYLIRDSKEEYKDSLVIHREVNLQTHTKYMLKLPIKFNEYPDSEFISGNPYAYGLVNSVYNSNVLMLDFDIDNVDTVRTAVEVIADNLPAREIDIVVSSRKSSDYSPIAFHLWVGLDDNYNTYDFYKTDLPGACQGFLNSVLIMRECVLRISNKFSVKTKDLTNLRWLEGYSKRKDEWLKYSVEQLIAPLTIADGVFLNETPPIKQPRLRLRG